MLLLSCSDGSQCKHRVSSTLNRLAEYASKNMFDGRDDTCWNSDQGSPQYILLEFASRVAVSRVRIMFQGGFVGQDAVVEVGEKDSLAIVATLQTIEDCNRMQSFDIISEGPEVARGGRYVKITFPTSTDFYGRVTIYKLELEGLELEE